MNFKEVPLGNLIKHKKGFAFKTQDYISTGITVIRVSNFTDNSIENSDLKFVSNFIASQNKNVELKENDIVIATVGSWANNPNSVVGKTILVPKWANGALMNQNAVILRSINDSLVDQLFIYYYMKQQVFKDLILSRSQGSANQASITLEAIFTCPVLFPNEITRISIVNILSSIDKKIALLKETNQTLESIAQAIFKSWFVDFDPVHARQQGIKCAGIDDATAKLFPDSFEESELGMIPKGWTVCTHKDLLKRIRVGKKYEQKTALKEGLVPILDQGKSGLIGYHNDEAGLNPTPTNPIIVFANHTCYMRLVSFPFSTIQNVLPFEGNEVDTLWLYQATKEKIKFEEYKGHWPDFEIKKVVCPSKELTKIYGEIVSPFYKKIFLNDSEVITLTKLRDTLLPRLISGKLDLSEIEEQLEGVV